MRKIGLLVLLVVLSMGVIACANENDASDDKDVREVVWGQLPSEQKDFIDGNWEDATVSKIELREGMMSSDLHDMSETLYIGNEVYAIDFPIKSTSSTNNITVFADVENGEYIGNGLVD
ncbi:hypothetical protein Q9251_17040 [Alkalihalobacillus macyae]|uniref:hypothetical protein n=1 Tax=Guptibacillus hwajinpoensis TaxID=208199 RepID=UPI00273B1965|nr:hypothetical protein [Alkalihalobacillus macyae]MDP4552586.1 hypothetical protein [Alkalihalobacillus macyae]